MPRLYYSCCCRVPGLFSLAQLRFFFHLFLDVVSCLWTPLHQSELLPILFLPTRASTIPYLTLVLPVTSTFGESIFSTPVCPSLFGRLHPTLAFIWLMSFISLSLHVILRHDKILKTKMDDNCSDNNSAQCEELLLSIMIVISVVLFHIP